MVSCLPINHLLQKEHINLIHMLFIGIVSGVVGGMGNLGGIIFAIMFRYNGSHYGQSLWIIGVICIIGNMAVSWIRPVPKSQTV